MDAVLGKLTEGSLYRRVVACRRSTLEEGIVAHLRHDTLGPGRCA